MVQDTDTDTAGAEEKVITVLGQMETIHDQYERGWLSEAEHLERLLALTSQVEEEIELKEVLELLKRWDIVEIPQAFIEQST